MEKALLRTRVAGHTHTIDLASHTLDASADLFGSTLSAVSDLDQWHSASAAAGRAISA